MRVDPTTAEKNLSIATEYFKLYYNEFFKDKQFAGGTTGFIPFKINVTLDGISGFKIYQRLEVNTTFLPPGYPITCEFIITGIDHNLKDNDWETNLKLILIPKFEEYTEILTTTNFNYVKPTVTIQPSPSTNNLPSNNSADGNSVWSSKVIQALDIVFPAGPASGVKSRCAEWVTKFVKALTNVVKGTNLPIQGGFGDAWSRAFTNNMLSLDIYELKASYTLENGNALTPTECQNLLLGEITKNAEYGDVVQYYLSDGNIKGNTSGVSRLIPPTDPKDPPISAAVYHTQEFSGKWFSGKKDNFSPYAGIGWTSSIPSNYGGAYVYRNRTYLPNDKYELFWFRVKDQYRK